MVKRGSMKYVWSGADPAQLFDLAADPLELHNLAGESAHNATEAELDGLVHTRWDVTELADRVLASQRRRAFLRGLYTSGNAPE